MITKATARLLTTLFVISLITALGCTDGGGGGGSNSDDPNAPKEFASNCGTILDGILQNPVKADRAEVGLASFTDTNTISLIINGEARRIKLLGLEDEEEDADNSAAEDVIKELLKEGPAYFFRANKDCVFKDQYGVKTFKGQVFSSKGKSFAEELVSAGVAIPGGIECNANLITTCYEILGEGDSDEIEEEDFSTPAATPTVVPDYLDNGDPNEEDFDFEDL